jgi:hypothetical protein
VLICAGCSYAWEPDDGAGTGEDLQGVDIGCPQCGDWLFLGELIDPAIPTTRRHGG